jgi:MFS family permease
MTYLGLTLGPFIGGSVAAWWSWRGVFWINIFVSSVLLIFAYRVLPDLEGSPQARFDFVGALTLIAAVSLVMIGVTGVGEVEVSARLWNLLRAGLVVAGLLFGFVFVARERRLEAAGKQPLVPLSLFFNRLFSLSAGISLLGYTCEFFIIFSLPFYLIRILGLSSAQAGFLFMAKSLLMIVVAPLSGDISDRKGP